jgi:tetraacyldisaccharide 4'-kinase
MIDRILLFPYSLALRFRHFCYDHGFIYKSRKAGVPTVCVGNIAVGGTGKTPHTEMILRTLLASDEWAYRNLAVLSRGYKRRSKGFQQVTADGSARLYGDEPMQMKKNFPSVTVAVDKNRVEGCAFLTDPEKLKTSRKGRRCKDKEFPTAELIVLDDAFQYRALDATVKIVLSPYSRPLTRDSLMPLGRLRDLPSRINTADIVIVTKCPKYLEDGDRETSVKGLGLKDYNPETCEAFTKKGKSIKVFFTEIDYQTPKAVYESGNPRYIYSKKAILFSGIADDTPLRMFLCDSYKIARSLSFSDHHRFTRADIRGIEAAVREHPTAALVTTEKDSQRLLDCPYVSDRLKERLFFVPIQAVFSSEKEDELFKSVLLSDLK